MVGPGKRGVARLSEKDRLALARAYADGENSEALAARYNVSVSYPGMLAKRYGFIKRERYSSGLPRASNGAGERKTVYEGKPRAKPSELPPKLAQTASADEIRRLAAKGVPRSQIGALLRCKYAEIERVLGK